MRASFGHEDAYAGEGDERNYGCRFRRNTSLDMMHKIKFKVAVLANWKSRLPPDRDQVVVLFLTRFCTGLQHRSPRDAEADHVSPSLREIEEVRVK